MSTFFDSLTESATEVTTKAGADAKENISNWLTNKINETFNSNKEPAANAPDNRPNASGINMKYIAAGVLLLIMLVVIMKR